MNKIIYVGMDVHSSNYTFCSFEPGYGIAEDKVFGQVQFKDDLRIQKSTSITLR